MMMSMQSLIVETSVLDRYSKTILTVIAAALIVSTAQRFLTPAEAQMGGCGRSIHEPCIMTLVGWNQASHKMEACDKGNPCIAVYAIPQR